MTDPKTLAASLRKMHAAKVHHFTPPGRGAQAFSIVATDDRMHDLLLAAEALDRSADDAALLDLGLICIDGRDDLGNDAVSVHCGLDTRQAIRRAAETVSGSEGPPVLLQQAANCWREKVRAAGEATLADIAEDPCTPDAQAYVRALCQRLGVEL